MHTVNLVNKQQNIVKQRSISCKPIVELKQDDKTYSKITKRRQGKRKEGTNNIQDRLKMNRKVNLSKHIINYIEYK